MTGFIERNDMRRKRMAETLEFLKSEWYPGRYSYPSKTNHAKYDILEDLEKAARPQHVCKPKSDGMSDKVKCSCGWESNGYWDMMEAALDEWLMHLAEIVGLVPKKCACGEIYVPFEGGKPCHKLKSVKRCK